jgi:hypothetical protein
VAAAVVVAVVLLLVAGSVATVELPVVEVGEGSSFSEVRPSHGLLTHCSICSHLRVYDVNHNAPTVSCRSAQRTVRAMQLILQRDGMYW